MPPEFMKTSKYDGCEATVWAMGILLVDMLSPVISAFEKPQHCLSMEPRIPQHFSSGVYQFGYFYSLCSTVQYHNELLLELKVFGNSGMMVGHLCPQLSIKVYKNCYWVIDGYRHPSQLRMISGKLYLDTNEMAPFTLFRSNPAIEITQGKILRVSNFFPFGSQRSRPLKSLEIMQ